MERTYASAAALVGPLASHLGPFVTSLIDQQYTASVIYIKVRHALAFDRGSRIACSAVGVDTNASAPRPDVVRWYEVTQLLQSRLPQKPVTHGLCPGHLPVRIDDEPRHRATGHSPTREIVDPIARGP
jgi:hypothetical protein